MAYALFKGGKQMSKAHSTKGAALIEAYERKVVVSSCSDFPDHEPMKSSKELLDGYEIREVGDGRMD